MQPGGLIWVMGHQTSDVWRLGNICHMANVEERNQAIFRESIDGLSMKLIGERHNVCRETVRLVVNKRGDELVGHVIDAMQNPHARLLFHVPPPGGADFEHSVSVTSWIARRLRERGIDAVVDYAPCWTEDGQPDGHYVAYRLRS